MVELYKMNLPIWAKSQTLTLANNEQNEKALFILKVALVIWTKANLGLSQTLTQYATQAITLYLVNDC